MNSTQSQKNYPISNLRHLENYLTFTKNSVKHSTAHYFLKDFFYLEYVLCPIEDDEVCLKIFDDQGLYFIFCWQEEIQISINGDENKRLKEFDSVLLYDKESKGVALTFEKRHSYRFCIIGFNKHLKSENPCYMKCRDLFFNKMPPNKKIFIGRSCFKLLEKINNLSSLIENQPDSELIMEGLIYQILGMQMRLLSEVTNGESEDNCALTFNELKRVKSISETIQSNPSFEYTIEFLCCETNLSPFKLQEGFKKLVNCTAINFIRDARLEEAVKLMETTDLNISEIVYSIGLTSRSYFSKIFKQKYKCSPKFYKAHKSQKGLVV